LQSKTQERWVGSFYRSNQYITFDALTKLGIKQPAKHLKKLYPDGLGLETLHVAESIIDNVDGSIGEALSENHWVDIMGILPSQCSSSDATAILKKCPSYTKSKDAQIFCDSVICSRKFVDGCTDIFTSKIKEAAAAAAVPKAAAAEPAAAPAADTKASAAKSASVEEDGPEKSKKDKRKEKKAKKAKKGQQDDDDDDDQPPAKATKAPSVGGGSSGTPAFLQLNEIAKLLSQKLNEMPTDVTEEIAAHLVRPLAAQYEKLANEAVNEGINAGDVKREISALHKQYDALYINFSLYAQAVARFDPKDQDAFAKFLLGDLGEQLVNILFRLFSFAVRFKLPAGALSPGVRSSLIEAVPKNQQPLLVALGKAVVGKDLAMFIDALSDVEEEASVYVQKENTKKRDKSVAFKHQKGLSDLLKAESAPAMILHLVVVMLFQKTTNCMLSIPGRLVQNTIRFLAGGEDATEDSGLIPQADLQLLNKVLDSVKSGTPDDDAGQVSNLIALKVLILGKPTGAAAVAATAAAPAALPPTAAEITPAAEEPSAEAADVAEDAPAKKAPAKKKRMKATM
jgi:hypothetical protein